MSYIDVEMEAKLVGIILTITCTPTGKNNVKAIEDQFTQLNGFYVMNASALGLGNTTACTTQDEMNTCAGTKDEATDQIWVYFTQQESYANNLVFTLTF
jgi:hypothetical protein